MNSKENLFRPSEMSVPLRAKEAEYLKGLVNELPGKEIEEKLAFKVPIEPVVVVEGIAQYFETAEKDFTLLTSRRLSATNTVEKYTYKGKSFSLVRRDDGVTFIKRKMNKEIRNDVLIQDEQKILLPDGTSLAEMLSEEILPEDITHLATMQRKKDGILLLHKYSGRVYVVIVDSTNRMSQPDIQLWQCEIEYKGRRSPIQTDGAGNINAIVGEILQVRSEIVACLEEQGVRVKLTQETKSSWLRKQIAQL